jgi:hypothetical protein
VANLADVIVDDSSNESAGNSEAARTALTEAVTASTEQATTVQGNSEATGTSQPAEDLPPKFRGKSAKEIVDMYQNLESRTGSMANELGVQRQLTDRLLGLKREDDLRANGSRQEKAKPVPVTTNDVLDRPQETIERVVTDKVQAVSDELRQENRQLRAQVAQQRFESRHSDYRQTVSDPAFIQWVQSSPLRMRAAAVANGGDWEVADELFTEYESNARSSSTVTTDTKQETRKSGENLDEARRASYTSSGSNSNDGQGKPAGKIYKRSDLMRLMMEDPDAYYDEAFQSEIILAHAEKRVR